MTSHQNKRKPKNTHMRTIFITTLCCLFALSAQAQRNGKRAERIKAFRVAIFTEVLDLTQAEAEAFWPIYNEMETKRRALKKEYRGDKNTEGLTDEELEFHLQRFFEREQKELDLRKAYTERFKKVLPLSKVVKIHHAEKQFREQLLRRVAERRQQRNED